MDSESNRGITKACPECRKILIAVAEMVGYGQFHQNIKCAYCGTRLKIVIGQKTFITVSKVLLVILAIIFTYQVLLLDKLNTNLSSLIQNYDYSITR